MKKRIFNVGVFVAVALVAGYNVYRSQKPAEMSDMALANVEALASVEGDSWIPVAECKYRIASRCYQFIYNSPWDPGTIVRQDDMEYVN